MIFWEVVTSFVVVILQAGPLARLSFWGSSEPLLFLLLVWAWSWLANRQAGFTVALVAGIMLDTLSFQPFGFWTVTGVVLVLLTDFLKSRFLEVSSLAQSLLCLAVGYGVIILAQLVALHHLFWRSSIIGLAVSLLLGALTYYIVAIRSRLFAHWRGQRL